MTKRLVLTAGTLRGSRLCLLGSICLLVCLLFIPGCESGEPAGTEPSAPDSEKPAAMIDGLAMLDEYERSK